MSLEAIAGYTALYSLVLCVCALMLAGSACLVAWLLGELAGLTRKALRRWTSLSSEIKDAR